MKKIFASILLLLCLQNGFCNNNSSIIIEKNNELAQKMSKDKNVVKLFKLSLAKKLSEEISVENTKNGINISTEEKVEFDKLCSRATIAYQDILTKYPEFEKLSINEKNDVLKVAGTLIFTEIWNCINSHITTDCGLVFTATIQQISFWTCMGICAVADIIIGVEAAPTGAAAIVIANLAPIITTEASACYSFSIGAATTVCVGISFKKTIDCLQSENTD